MEKVAKWLGGNESMELVKNVIYLLVAFGSLTFAAGTYFGNAKDLPARVDTLERKADHIDVLASDVKEIRSDVREIRAVIMRNVR